MNIFAAYSVLLLWGCQLVAGQLLQKLLGMVGLQPDLRKDQGEMRSSRYEFVNPQEFTENKQSQRDFDRSVESQNFHASLPRSSQLTYKRAAFAPRRNLQNHQQQQQQVQQPQSENNNYDLRKGSSTDNCVCRCQCCYCCPCSNPDYEYIDT